MQSVEMHKSSGAAGTNPSWPDFTQQLVRPEIETISAAAAMLLLCLVSWCSAAMVVKSHRFKEQQEETNNSADQSGKLSSGRQRLVVAASCWLAVRSWETMWLPESSTCYA